MLLYKQNYKFIEDRSSVLPQHLTVPRKWHMLSKYKFNVMSKLYFLSFYFKK